MAVDQLPGAIREFANYLDALLGRLDQGAGWCGVFWQRDPEGMQACLDGREVPPWDVLEALLQDLAAAYGPAAAGAEGERARPLHTAAVRAYDALPGARDALADRLGVMLREQRYAAERQAELGGLLTAAATHEEADALRVDLAWARDDHDRASARCAELRRRMAESDRRTTALPLREPPAAGHDGMRGMSVEGSDGRRGMSVKGPGGRSGVSADGIYKRPGTVADGPEAWFSAPAAAQAPRPAAEAPQPTASPAPEVLSTTPEFVSPAPEFASPTREAAVAPATEASAPARARRRRRGSARFAGMAEDEGTPAALPQTAAAPVPQAPAGRRAPRGARFAGAGEAVAPAQPSVAGAVPGAQADGAARDGAAGAAVAGAVDSLGRLRAQGRSGEAHALLAEIAHWPAARLPLLADGLHRAGLGADWATLLWEAASLPAERLVAAADALVAAGRAADGQQMLRQGVARPAAEIGAAVLALDGEGRAREVRALLDAYVRVRTPEEAARSAAAGPGRLVPLLLQAALGVSEERHWDLVHAVRVAGFTA
ncbi:hypothetical protein ACFZCP_16005 [Streptomyces sp. NPDC007971]|uniref:hypothetical protein n=1 Tax=Streptomyces sp. NPDC007971 TaxID=3364799 RepID=UPI0036EDD67C